jgi:hypothetical protein
VGVGVGERVAMRPVKIKMPVQQRA